MHYRKWINLTSFFSCSNVSSLLYLITLDIGNNLTKINLKKKPAVSISFHFQGCKIVKQNLEMKQNWVGTVWFLSYLTFLKFNLIRNLTSFELIKSALYVGFLWTRSKFDFKLMRAKGPVKAPWKCFQKLSKKSPQWDFLKGGRNG